MVGMVLELWENILLDREERNLGGYARWHASLGARSCVATIKREQKFSPSVFESATVTGSFRPEVDCCVAGNVAATRYFPPIAPISSVYLNKFSRFTIVSLFWRTAEPDLLIDSRVSTKRRNSARFFSSAFPWNLSEPFGSRAVGNYSKDRIESRSMDDFSWSLNRLAPPRGCLPVAYFAECLPARKSTFGALLESSREPQRPVFPYFFEIT